MRTSQLDEVGTRDGWRCWICDEPVDPDMSVNDPRGPSVDSLTSRAASSKASAAPWPWTDSPTAAATPGKGRWRR